MAFIWVPFAVAAHLVSSDPQRLPQVVSATLVFSFTHQPLTLWLVYGDRAQRERHRRVFLYAPFVAAPAIWAGSMWQPGSVAVVAGAWNVWHTLRQRYGISRLYGRLDGIDCGGDNRLLWSWFSVAALVAAGGAGDLARDAGLGARNTEAVDALERVASFSAWLLPVAVVVAAGLTVAALGAERRRERRGVARLVYLGSTGALLILVAVAPVVGFVAYVGAHAAEYFLMVRWRVARAARQGADGDAVGATARRVGAIGSIALYGAGMAVFVAGVSAYNGNRVAGATVLTMGALHLLFDGFIWRSSSQPGQKAPSAHPVAGKARVGPA